MSEIPAREFKVAPLEARTFCGGFELGLSEDGKIFAFVGRTLDGGRISLEMPSEVIAPLIDALRDVAAKLPQTTKLVIPQPKVPPDLNGQIP